MVFELPLHCASFYVWSLPHHPAHFRFSRLHDHMSQSFKINLLLSLYPYYWFSFSGELSRIQAGRQSHLILSEGSDRNYHAKHCVSYLETWSLPYALHRIPLLKVLIWKQLPKVWTCNVCVQLCGPPSLCIKFPFIHMTFPNVIPHLWFLSDTLLFLRERTHTTPEFCDYFIS